MPNPYEGDPRCVALYEDFPLLTGEDIRLVTLEPGIFGDDLRCTLMVKPGGTKYEALSYTWGIDGMPSMFDILDGEDEEHEEEKNRRPNAGQAIQQSESEMDCIISVNSHHIPIMANLSAALQHLRQESEPRTLWIDYLCINQNSIDDRNQQVSRMASIYNQAHRVVVWLGLETSNCAVAYEELKYFGKGLHLSELYPQSSPKQIYQTLLPIIELFSRPWFARMWTVQEVALSRNVVVMAGRLEMEWKVFLNARDASDRHASCCADIEMDPDFTFNSRNMSAIRYAVPDVGDALSSNLAGGTLSCTARVASDPRDKIFSLLSIVDKYPFRPPNANPIRGPRLEMVPDYNLSEQEVFRRATLQTIHDSRKLDTIIASGDFSGRPGIPSWVVDFRNRHTIGRRLMNRYDCSLSTLGELHQCSPERLNIPGVGFQAVAEVGPRLRYHVDALSAKCIKSTHETLTAWETMKDYPQVKRTVYGSMKGRDEAFWQTMWRGYNSLKGGTLHPKDQETYDNWRLWVKCEATGYSRRFWRNWKLDRDKALQLQLSMLGETASFFATNEGYFGMAYPAAEPGDAVTVLGGGNLPFLIRQLDEDCEVCKQASWRIVAFAYVHGIMNGELIRDHRRGIFGSTRFCLK